MYPHNHPVIILAQLDSTERSVLCYAFYRHCKVLKNLVLLCSSIPPVCSSLLTADAKERKSHRTDKPVVIRYA